MPNEKIIVINQLTSKKDGSKNKLGSVKEYQIKLCSDKEYEQWLNIMTNIQSDGGIDA